MDLIRNWATAISATFNQFIEELFTETLVLVSTRRERDPVGTNDYVYIDWGPEYRASHAAAYPDIDMPGLALGAGVAGLEYILNNGGAGYLPLRVVKPFVDERTLHFVPKAPRFEPLPIRWTDSAIV